LRFGTLAGVTLLRSCDRSQRVCTLCLPWGRWVHVRPDDFPRRARSSWPGAGFRRALPVRTGFGRWRCAGGCNLCPLPWPGSPGQDCRMIACPIRPPFGGKRSFRPHSRAVQRLAVAELLSEASWLAWAGACSRRLANQVKTQMRLALSLDHLAPGRPPLLAVRWPGATGLAS
jgi:hypothetical protein